MDHEFGFPFFSFNTQPPEGGWFFRRPLPCSSPSFQHAAARRRLGPLNQLGDVALLVSTRSRPKAAGISISLTDKRGFVSTRSRPKAAGFVCLAPIPEPCGFNTQPPEGGWTIRNLSPAKRGGFNTQPPEGGWLPIPSDQALRRSFNTQPPEGGWAKISANLRPNFLFQHAAARRRLVYRELRRVHVDAVSTRSRPKAAGFVCIARGISLLSFNTQPPEGGWVPAKYFIFNFFCFNTQPPEGGWNPLPCLWSPSACFNTQPPEGGWVGLQMV